MLGCEPQRGLGQIVHGWEGVRLSGCLRFVWGPAVRERLHSSLDGAGLCLRGELGTVLANLSGPGTASR